MKKAIIYTRVSTGRQATEGISLETQEKQCIKKAEELGYKNTKIFTDEGVSGGKFNRAGLQDMLKEINKDPEIEVLVVQHTDRLARSVEIHRTIVSECKKNNVKIYALTQGFLEYTPNGKLNDGFMSLLNEHQKDLISYKTRESMRQKAENGWLPKVPPVGYLNSTIKLGHLNTMGKKEEKIIIVDKQKAPLVKKAFRLYATGNYSAEEINNKLYTLGLTSPRGGKMHSSKIYYLLKNRFYLGELKYGDIYVEKAQHPPIIDKKIFDAVQLMMDVKNKFACRQRKYNFLLRSFIHCHKCGKKYTAEAHPKKNKTYYHCSNKHCLDKPKYIELAILEDMVSEKFKQIEFKSAFIDQIIDRVKISLSKNRKEMNQTKQMLINKRMSLEKERDVIEDKLIANVIDDDDFKRMIGKCKDRLSEINQQLNEIEVKRNVDTSEIQKILLLTRNVYKAYIDADQNMKRRYLNFFWEKIEVSGREIIEAVPSRLFKAILDLKKVDLKETKNSPYEEEFFIPNRPLSKEKVIIRNAWGA